MMIYSFGDIILVPFTFTDQSSRKKRPAVIVSSDNYNHTKPDLIIMAITSQMTFPLGLGEYQIVDFSSAGLLKPSVIKPIISTVEKTLIIRKLDQLKKTDCQQLKKIIFSILG